MYIEYSMLRGGFLGLLAGLACDSYGRNKIATTSSETFKCLVTGVALGAIRHLWGHKAMMYGLAGTAVTTWLNLEGLEFTNSCDRDRALGLLFGSTIGALLFH